MTLVANSALTPKFSHVFIDELWPEHGYCRETVSLTKLAGMKVGSVIQRNGTYLLASEVTDAASVVTAAPVIIADEAIYDVADGATVVVGVIVKGPVMAKKQHLHFSDIVGSTGSGSTGDADAVLVYAYLESLGIKLVNAN